MSVLQAIPTFIMQYFRLPLQTCNEINSILANFWWRSDTANKKKIHWLSWKSLCKQKSEGGLGFRDTQSFNQALLCKQAWKLITEPNNPLSQVYEDRYFPRTSFWAVQLGPKPSYTWRSILSVRDLICKGIEWKLASRSNIRVCGHKWITHTHSKTLITPVQEDFHDITVVDLIDSEIRVWKIDFV
ncbi:hypothetical protein LIER_25480 [Lithospermum erythrorhizon]|uniref:Uncharacterized protein n=1 Tax=Lithospermum erythrorhizon TaxID=34254 RepID=A0AAV3R8M3_LITER